ncbi:MAG: AAA family ATPase [Bacteroidales bacterium]|nr:AAA family ATPase [Bacteroidales bacterium]
MTVENEIVNPQTEAEEATNVKDIKPSSKKIPSPKRSLPHQQIFYGAPGTGKSHTIKRVVEDRNLPHIRTTFHPDSDYSTFVGAYKPTTIDVPMRDVSGHIIVEGGNQVIEKKIIYTFVPQAFLKAYVAAWSNLNEPFFLIIEEINRGNCAQIFGDLFQLLDRNSEGISDYPVTPDDDIRKHLKAKFSELDDDQQANIPDEILLGEKMLLPRNLHIWATMNTSDQSLFPIDSAFKRRWDWKYTPIANGNKNWKITADGKEYDWWQFLEKINAQIGNATHSEDKKLGYYFCKPINNQTIDAETFVSKVVFYLWNDVFKDFAEDAGSIFNDEDGLVLSFNKFYTTDTDGNAVVVEQKVTQFLQNLGVAPSQDVE